MQHDTILYRIACKCCSEWWTENTQSHKVTESAAGRGWSIIFGRKQRCQRKRSLRLKRKRKWKWTGDQRFNMFLSDTSHMQIPASHCLQHMMFHLVLSFIIYHLIVSSSTRECGSRNSAALQVYSCENGSFLSEFCQFKPPVSTCRGVSSCCSLGWPAGWPDLYGGKNRPGWHNTCCANSVIWHQLCDATLYIQVLCNLATLQPVSLGGTGGPQLSKERGRGPWPPLRTASEHITPREWFSRYLCNFTQKPWQSDTFRLTNRPRKPMVVCQETAQQVDSSLLQLLLAATLNSAPWSFHPRLRLDDKGIDTATVDVNRSVLWSRLNSCHRTHA